MKIETLREYIPNYDRTVKEREYARKVRLSRQVKGDEKRRQQQQQQESSKEDFESDEQLPTPAHAGENHSGAGQSSLDVVV